MGPARWRRASMSPRTESGRRAPLLSRSPKRRRPAHHWPRPRGLSRLSRAHLGLQLLDLVLELADVLRRVRVVQLALDAALLSLRAGRASQHGVRSRSQSAARPPSPHRSPGSPAPRCAAASRPPPPCCPPPAGARPSPPPCSGGGGGGKGVKGRGRAYGMGGVGVWAPCTRPPPACGGSR